MPQVLTTNAQILCPHGGIGTSIPTDPKWSVNGGIVLLENDTGTLSCPFIYPCRDYLLRSMGLNALKVGDRKVILVTDFNKTLTGLPLRMTEFHQTMDDSTPAPIPAGQQAPPLSPALLDAIAPVVTAATPAAAYTLAAPPVPLVVTFTLFSNFPGLWRLTLISETPGSDSDLTNGDPLGAVAAPSGGNWNTPNLTVNLTLTKAYMTDLGLGRHHLYMTGVNQRGLSNYAETLLIVS
jgi:hypothetical protein